MSAAENRAVFLSYASQDAGAARRICEALREAGVPVWFDVEGGLEHGDEWDAKIRRQIKECTLFIAVISANTQARHEGYFRIEWELAAERAMGIASGVAFILPVLIDDTREPEALVPDRFRKVQWTRASGGVLAPEVQARFLKLWSHRAGAVLHPPGQGTDGPNPPGSPEFVAAPAQRRTRLVLGATVLAGVLAGGIFLAMRPKPAAPADAPAKLPTPAVTAAAWPRDPQLKRTMNLINGFEANAEDFVLAEEITDRVLTSRPMDSEAVTVMARVENAFILRGFDRSDERVAKARRFAERAVQLAPDDAEALAALGSYIARSDLARARELLERAIALKPTEPYFHRQRDAALFNDPAVSAATAIAAAEKTAGLFPNDALAHYDLARRYRDVGRIADMERELDRTIAITPIGNAIVWKSRIALWARGDPAEMKALIDRVPSRVRGLERVVFSRWVYAMAAGAPEEGLSALENLTSNWIEDFDYVGPKALLAAQLLERLNKPGLARLQYEAALAEVRARQSRTPGEASLRGLEVWIMHGLGRNDEARTLNRVRLETVARPYVFFKLSDWWFTPIPGCLLIGDRATALQLIREAVSPAPGAARPRGIDSPAPIEGRGPAENAVEARAALRLRFKFDPRMTPFRDNPEIAELLAEPAKALIAAPLSEGAQLAARAQALYEKVGFTRDDLAPAEDFARRATEREPDSAAAWGVRAGVQSAWLFRGWDTSEKRLQDTQSYANRAIALDPNEPEALLALGHVLRTQRAGDQAVVHLRRVSAANPEHVRLARALGYTLNQLGRDDEARAVLLEMVKRAPRDPLLRYEIALTYGNYGPGGGQPGNLSAALDQLDAAIAIQPFASALVLKATLLGGWRGDLAAMRAALDQLEKLPLAERSEDRAVCVAMWAGLMEHRPDRVEAAAALTARNYFDDSVMPFRPKAWSLALAHRIAGKENVARADWQSAEAVLRQRLKDEPGNNYYKVELAITLAWLGERDEAARLIGEVEPIWQEEPTYKSPRLLAFYYAALGDATRAAPYLAASLDQNVFTSRKLIAVDPSWEKLRGQPEFEALLK